jgi:hypothetical protein
MTLRNLLFGVFLTTLLLLPRAASACPMCAEAVPDTSGAEARDAEAESRAYNNSIYLMVAMPYLLLGGMGLMIYRGYRRQAKLTEKLSIAGAESGGIGHVSLPTNPSEDLPPSGSAG